MSLAIAAPWLGIITRLVVDMAEVTPEERSVRQIQLGSVQSGLDNKGSKGTRQGGEESSKGIVVWVTQKGGSTQHSKNPTRLGRQVVREERCRY